ncbi:ATP-grasp domain-containing protein [Krasilnikovia sp. MM14-A1259]|uniref:ATP-grasp domain-containing protein n=1 Tax=Krasilnikovia sp. MM14-A1259 TaxID=3373539 RepID=UPI00382F2560
MLVFVEAGIAGTGLSALAWADHQGIDVGLISVDPERYANGPDADLLGRLAARERVFRSADTDAENPDTGLSDWVRASGTPHGVVCIGDRHLPFAAALAAELGTPFHPVAAVATLRDKRAARQVYAELGIRSPRWTPVAVADDALRLFAQAGPVVLKNVKGSGSMDVLLCRTADEVREHFATLSERQRYLGGDLMAEEFVAGPLYSMETVVSGGTCLCLGSTDRQLGPRPHFCELSYTFPVPLPQAAFDEMTAGVRAIARRLGITHGFLHSEFILTAGGPVLVEVNARIGGGLLALMMNDCLTVSCWELLCRTALGEPVTPPEHNGRYASAVTVYPPVAGILAARPDRNAVAAAPFVSDVILNAAPGDPVRPPTDYRGSVCQVRTCADTPGMAYNAALAAARDIPVALAS